jgi:hypothetical protein
VIKLKRLASTGVKIVDFCPTATSDATRRETKNGAEKSRNLSPQTFNPFFIKTLFVSGQTSEGGVFEPKNCLGLKKKWE